MSRRGALGVAGAGVAGAVLSATRADAATAPAATPSVDQTLTSDRTALVLAVAKAMATVPVALPYRRGKDTHPLDRATAARVRKLAGHLTPERLARTTQGIDTLAAAGLASAPAAKVASAVASRTDWDADDAVAAALTLAAAVVTPLGFCDTFPRAWATLLRSRTWSAVTVSTTGAGR